MNSLPPPRTLLFASTVAIALLSAAYADETTTSVKFSDPRQPGTVKVSVARGDIDVAGADVAEVIVKSDGRGQHPQPPRKDGLRVLTESVSFSLQEKDNVVTLDALSEGWGGPPSNLRITVPRNTNVVISSAYGGDVSCSGVSGNIEVKSLNGRVRLEDIVGSTLVETTNGEITATIRELHENKPVSFTSTNGAVVLHVPEKAKANIRLRTRNGSILTDFDEKTFETKVETMPHGSRSKGLAMLTPEARDAFREAARAGAEAARHAAEAIREATEAAREGAGFDFEGHPNAPKSMPMPELPVIPRTPAIPAVTGGKLVTGTLNGGGPEITAATMNGDVVLRRLEKK